MSKTHVSWTCPYCGLKQGFLAEVTPLPDHLVMHCDLDEGGCEGRVVLDVYFEVRVEVAELVGERESVAADIASREPLSQHA